jgi:hypothetical protein
MKQFHSPPPTHVKDTLATLNAVNKAKNCAETRGKARIPVAKGKGKYTTIGLKPNRGRTSITESWPDKLSETDQCNVVKLMNTIKELAKGYLPSDALRGIEKASLLGNDQWPRSQKRWHVCRFRTKKRK